MLQGADRLEEDEEQLRHRLMAYTLLHQYADLNWLAKWIVGRSDHRDLCSLARDFWPIER
jgi:hypothetical protein